VRTRQTPYGIAGQIPFDLGADETGNRLLGLEGIGPFRRCNIAAVRDRGPLEPEEEMMFNAGKRL
jgi:hypothetical protein